jgi:hypothetical protein
LKDYARIARKITTVLFLVQRLSSAGFIALFTVNTLVGAELTGRRALAGVPEAVRVLGLVGALASLVPLEVAVWWRLRGRLTPPAPI